MASSAFEAIDGVEVVSRDGATITMRVSGPIGTVLTAAAPHGLVDVVSREPNLEDVFLAQYGHGNGAVAPSAGATDGR